MSKNWTAPHAKGPLNATVVLPGSKSQTSRALVIGAIAANPTQIDGGLASRDTYLAAKAMQHLGAKLDFEDGANRITVIPADHLRGGGTIDCGSAGTVMRFATAIAAFAEGKTRFIGDPGALKRPLGPLMDALELFGARVKYEGVRGHLPLRVRGAGTKVSSPLGELGDLGQWGVKTEGNTGSVVVDTSGSSQYLSALLLASPLFPNRTLLRAEGRLPSWPYVAMSIDMLSQQEVEIEQVSSSAWLTTPSKPAGNSITVEPDLSNAGPFLAAALLAGGRVTILGWPPRTQQVGKYWLELLPKFGASVIFTDEGLTVVAPEGLAWPGMEFDMGPYGELAPTVAALCLFATSSSTIFGVGHLRGHETDRLAALAEQIERLGGKAKVLRDGIRITPGPLRPRTLHTYDDHRMATFAALVGLRVPGCKVQNVETTVKTLPLFPQRWNAMLEGAQSPEPLHPKQVHEDPSLVSQEPVDTTVYAGSDEDA